MSFPHLVSENHFQAQCADFIRKPRATTLPLACAYPLLAVAAVARSARVYPEVAVGATSQVLYNWEDFSQGYSALVKINGIGPN